MSNPGRPNRLIEEKSPYLRQHAFQPVEWHPWGDEAFEHARAQDRPVFLSIGYATCHWCHVMAHESFDDEEIARLMNRVFVSIKVDREERPDIDHLYMRVATLLTGSGGWPLSVVMTPDGVPFFAATYLPPHSLPGRLGMKELTLRIETAWLNERERIHHSGREIMSALTQMDHDPTPGSLGVHVIDSGFQALEGQSDRQYGGLGLTPKFPLAHNLLFLFRYWKRTGEGKAFDLAQHALDAMRRGGIFDHIGFGFHRYSTDRFWLVPHFEKMLYDQALLAMAYTEGAKVTGNDEYQQTAREVYTYVFRDLTSPEGAFYSAEDADSEGIEGKFYLWTAGEIRDTLGPEGSELFLEIYSIREEGNFTPEHVHWADGKNIVFLKHPFSYWEQTLNVSRHDLTNLLESGREKLLAARSKRTHPLKDDKILTDWNGLMIAALARSARAWGDQELAGRGATAAHFFIERMVRPDGTLFHRFREGEAAIPGYLDDYAFLTWGLIELYQALFDARYLEWALKLTETMIRLFEDAQGGFFFTSQDSTPLIDRQKERHDGAIPSGNAVAVANLIRLHRLCRRPEFERSARKTLERFIALIEHNPLAHVHMLSSLDLCLGPSVEVVVVGVSTDPSTREMLDALNHIDPSHVSVLFVPEDDPACSIRTIAPFTRDHAIHNGKPTAYLCRDFTCRAPTNDLAELLEILS